MCSGARRPGRWLLGALLVSGLVVGCGEGEKPGVGPLVCSAPEELRIATVVVRQPTAPEAANAAFALSVGEVDAVEVGADGKFLAIVAGRYVASVEPQRRGDGSWDVAEVATCTRPEAEPLDALIDGELDCAGAGLWRMFTTFAADASGPPTPEEALVGYLEQARNRYRGRIAFHADASATLVVDSREVIRATAIATPGGNWVVPTASGCDGFGG